MLQLYIGEGKGKTTAAIGLAIRALGWSQKVLFSQFLKSGESGEVNLLESMDGLDFYRPSMRHKGFIWNMDDRAINETKEDLQKGFDILLKRLSENDYHLVVMDELLDVIDCGFIDESQVLDFLNNAVFEVVLTGRKASLRLKESAQYITNMTKEKHPFDLGISARKGIEY